MDPAAALASDQRGFEQDLDQMITEVMSRGSRTTSTISPLSPPLDRDKDDHTPRKRRLSIQSPPTAYSSVPAGAKRRRFEEPTLQSASGDQYMHPARSAMLNDPPPADDTTENAPHIFESPSTGLQMSVTAANAIPVGLQGPAEDVPTYSSLHNTVRRQWDPRTSNLDYQELLKHRRNERLANVDRYVPLWSGAGKPKSTARQPFCFDKLPEKAQNNILRLLLISDDPISIDFTWLRPFVKGHARIPAVMQKLQDGAGAIYTTPTPWNKMLAEVESMTSDMTQFKGALETRGAKNKARRSPARHLTTSLLWVSHAVHKSAARVFYGSNTFHFSHSLAAWMHLESFLETIGPSSVGELKHIRIAAPMFHRGMQEDYVEGAILDLMSPATRLAMIRPPARDRLLSAITHSVSKLKAADSLETLNIDLEHPMTSDLWSGRYLNDKRLISALEVEKFVERKVAAIAVLREASDLLTAKGRQPTVTLYHYTKSSRSDEKEFRRALPGLIKEAEKYGWRVHPRLHGGK